MPVHKNLSDERIFGGQKPNKSNLHSPTDDDLILGGIQPTQLKTLEHMRAEKDERERQKRRQDARERIGKPHR